MHRLIARLWRLIRGPLQWRILWLRHDKFMIGVTGIVRDDDGHVLLLRHRMWPPDRQWGCPTGYAEKGETWEDTIVREVREETGLHVKAGRLVHVTTGYKLRVEAAYEAQLAGGTLKIDPAEILEAKWYSPHQLPEGLQESHRLLIEQTAKP